MNTSERSNECLGASVGTGAAHEQCNGRWGKVLCGCACGCNRRAKVTAMGGAELRCHCQSEAHGHRGQCGGPSAFEYVRLNESPLYTCGHCEARIPARSRHGTPIGVRR